eukprot:Plantae.Rhodophyta-Rhodochaete_pulchella.ctg5619.p2 GENE.Plantae.Rhodophyta-Rhodochaete_pulchella.ctg5619~~Plantae.Rhodophyta-Rhodochaete_pulchella.ctg5619.p2  ORF type:complete len:240 (+),score=33.48 Plantae.Rhodophyta-Rhodochaete_pulchella.ctg5619:63-782(+)
MARSGLSFVPAVVGLGSRRRPGACHKCQDHEWDGNISVDDFERWEAFASKASAAARRVARMNATVSVVADDAQPWLLHLQLLYDFGIRNFHSASARTLREAAAAIPEDAHWRLSSSSVRPKKLAQVVSMPNLAAIEGLDSMEAVDEVEKARSKGRIRTESVPVLVRNSADKSVVEALRQSSSAMMLGYSVHESVSPEDVARLRAQCEHEAILSVPCSDVDQVDDFVNAGAKIVRLAQTL